MILYGDIGYWAIVVLSIVLGGATQAYINSTYNKWSKVRSGLTATGAQVARRMLDEGGARACGIGRTQGHLTDHYMPSDNNLYLSEENYSGGSVASVAVACHEAGHAVQTAKGYFFGRFRTALVPVVNFTQSIWMLVFLAGVFLNVVGLKQVAIALFAFSVLFQLVTLPVEIDASRRAVKFLSANGSADDQQGSRQVLIAAALTYVSAALISVLNLLYMMSRNRR